MTLFPSHCTRSAAYDTRSGGLVCLPTVFSALDRLPHLDLSAWLITHHSRASINDRNGARRDLFSKRLGVDGAAMARLSLCHGRTGERRVTRLLPLVRLSLATAEDGKTHPGHPHPGLQKIHVRSMHVQHFQS